MGGIINLWGNLTSLTLPPIIRKGFVTILFLLTKSRPLVESFKRYGCYATYFFYSDEVLTYMSAQECAPTIAGYKGKVWAPFLPIDLDHPDLLPALEAARHLTSFLARTLANRFQCYPDLF